MLAGLLAGTLSMAARASAQAAVSFEQVPLPIVQRPSHVGAYAAGGSGLALIGASFVWAHAADQNYADYRAETDPTRIEDRWNATVHADRLAGASLIAGEVLVATAVWMRFVHRPSASRVALTLTLDRCALALRF